MTTVGRVRWRGSKERGERERLGREEMKKWTALEDTRKTETRGEGEGERETERKRAQRVTCITLFFPIFSPPLRHVFPRFDRSFLTHLVKETVTYGLRLLMEIFKYGRAIHPPSKIFSLNLFSAIGLNSEWARASRGSCDGSRWRRAFSHGTPIRTAEWRRACACTRSDIITKSEMRLIANAPFRISDRFTVTILRS